MAFVCSVGISENTIFTRIVGLNGTRVLANDWVGKTKEFGRKLYGCPLNLAEAFIDKLDRRIQKDW